MSESIHELQHPDQTISSATLDFHWDENNTWHVTITSGDRQWHASGGGGRGLETAQATVLKQLEMEGYQFFANRQRREIPMLTPNQTQKTAQVVRWQAGDNYVQITCDGHSWQGRGHDALASLIDVRQRFEPDGYRLLCYGASLYGLASGMSRDSDMVYHMEWRQSPESAKTKTIHDVFDAGPDVIPATYQEQQVFKEQWHASVKLDRKGIAYDLCDYPVVSVDRQGNIARCDLGQNMMFTETIRDVDLEVVFIPSGTFLMGMVSEQDDSSSERYRRDEPQHEVRIGKQFWMGKYPITKAQWRAIATLPQIQDEMRPEPFGHHPHVDDDLDTHPISCISWYEAIEFCRRLSAHTGRQYRLPTEAEWEYACKAGTMTPFHFGESFLLERSQLPAEFIASVTSPSFSPSNQMYLLNYDGLMKGTTPVGSYPANPWGLHDMHGNVWEWCLDHWHWDYSTKPETYKQDGHYPWTKGNSREGRKYRPVRGGTCGSFIQECLSTSRQRGGLEANPLGEFYGLRVLCESL
ncbi:MAG: formylglycine-generating enzyme family protein [Cyanobacteria bacterium J06633_2]